MDASAHFSCRSSTDAATASRTPLTTVACWTNVRLPRRPYFRSRPRLCGNASALKFYATSFRETARHGSLICASVPQSKNKRQNLALKIRPASFSHGLHPSETFGGSARRSSSQFHQRELTQRGRRRSLCRIDGILTTRATDSRLAGRPSSEAPLSVAGHHFAIALADQDLICAEVFSEYEVGMHSGGGCRWEFCRLEDDGRAIGSVAVKDKERRHRREQPLIRATF